MTTFTGSARRGNRISLSSIRSSVPNIVQNTVGPAISLKAELSLAEPMASSNKSSSRKPSVAASVRSQNAAAESLPQSRLASSEKADPDEEIAALALTDLADWTDHSSTAMKLPPLKNHFRSGSVSFPVPSRTGSFATSSFEQQDASIRAIKSTRGSTSTGSSYVTPDAGVPVDTRKRSVASGASQSSPEGFPASEAIATQDGGDSPTLGQFPLPPTTKPRKGKARDSMLLHRHSRNSDSSTKPQKERTSTMNSQDTEMKAEKGLAISFLPKFLKLAGSPRQSMSAETERHRDSMEITEVDELPPKQHDQALVKSVFEAESSDEEYGGDYGNAYIGGAEIAVSRQPTLIKTGNSGGKRVMSIQDILSEGGIDAVADHLHRSGTSVLADDNPGPSQGKAKRILGESSIKMKRAGIVGMPAVDKASRSVQLSVDNLDEPATKTPRRQADLLDGLRSNPVKRAATVPSSRKVILPLDLGDQQKIVRDKVVSTPYPPGYSGRKSGEDDSARSQQITNLEKRPHKAEAVIMLILYSQNGHTPAMQNIVVPETKGLSMVDEDEKRPPFRATLKVEFDDEWLFRLIRREYTGMRGVWKGVASARGVNGISLLGYHRLSDLGIKEERLTRRKAFRVYDDVFTEQRMIDLFTSPRKGRKQQEWVEWIRRLPPNSQDLHTDEENLAVELVEGWKVRRIAFAFLLVIVLSILATLLWTFLGVDGGIILQNDAMLGFPVQLKMKSAGFRGASIRIGTGLTLGVLVLLLGWTAVGSWILLSWLVM
ncbi:MAG: hypothetical protein Q9220_005844 [cf. Caloplaca sp. 1 TL-2023]